ncbi:hypothetical protein IW140_001880 [Coemansia sp. RSA 1813]|nr:hypothetical protein EV178_005033 [Coemansia sp. RSA 1646]KAJ1772375.1 hypothetical protein LPJ74_001465 [Coemansia sp. RSA 1843]KAJ2091100.1 hypothetical protein IW138_002062 [Coemansia sp. RSA 986]KAJ2212130.1 hypothetical protein EV179_004927 [Coemansia sp. RSA 487]KAJ2571177.1 hypothetical protein IW140_001880 [Coemansia sp. RSA 1813]
MQAVFRLILEGLAMFAGSWAAGCVPLYVKMDNAKFNLLALFGAGLLIGAALAVILPEGVETMIKALMSKNPSSTDELTDSVNTTIGWSLVAGFCLMFLIDNLFSSPHNHGESSHGSTDVGNDSGACLEDIPMTDQSNGAGDSPRRGARSDYTLNDANTSQNTSDSMTTLNIGHANSGNESSRYDNSDPNRSGALKRGPQWRRILSQLGRALSPWNLPSTLLGILVHSCADGLALGAAVAASASMASGESSDANGSSSIELIVFFALLLHKAPAAFGLITTLKQQGYAHYKLSVWLTMFAASAPLAALATFSIFLLASPSEKTKQPDHHAGVQPWTGIIMLFSAGTFMYVAMAHTLTEAVHQAKMLKAKVTGNSAMAKLGLLDIAVLLLGIILPPLVSKDHD